MSEPDLQESLDAVANPPVYSGDVMLDHLYGMVLRLVQELAVTREELDTLRRAVAGLDQATLDDIAASPEFAREQLENHRELVQRILGDLPAVGE